VSKALFYINKFITAPFVLGVSEVEGVQLLSALSASVMRFTRALPLIPCDRGHTCMRGVCQSERAVLGCNLTSQIKRTVMRESSLCSLLH